jgi:hypothetical protein
MYMEILNSAVDSQILGLLLDILGAYYLVRSFIQKGFQEMFQEAHGDFEGLPYDTLYGSYVQKIEAEIGLVLLVPGFVLQALSIIFFLKLPLFFIFIILALFYAFAELYFKFYSSRSKFNKMSNLETTTPSG